MIASSDDFLSHVAAHAGVPNERAERAIRAVLGGFGPLLDPAARRLVADELPPGLATFLVDGYGRALPIEERVLEPGTTLSQARELVASVCRVLAEELSAEAVRVLRESAPATVAPYLESTQEIVGSAGTRRDTLAAGRPGSHHPVSESKPTKAHTDSIAAPNPHAGTKLSSSPGSTQEREHETMAEGHPASEHTIARTHG